MTAGLHHYIVTASWDPEGCYECDGGTGQAFVFVRAHDGKEAVETARECLMPTSCGQARFVAATELALPVAPQASKARRIAEREFCIRAGSYVSVLQPATEART